MCEVSTMTNFSVKPYAIMEFENLLATALSYPARTQKHSTAHHSNVQHTRRCRPGLGDEGFVNGHSEVQVGPSVREARLLTAAHVTQLSRPCSDDRRDKLTLIDGSSDHWDRNPRDMFECHHGNVVAPTNIFSRPAEQFESDARSITLQQLASRCSPSRDLKPGPNLIKPIAFKPVQMSPNHSPVGHLNRRTSAPDDTSNGPHEMNRPHGMKLGVSMLGVRGSPDSSHTSRSNPGAFNSMAKTSQLNPSGQHVHNLSADHSQSSHPSSVTSSHNSSHHSSGSCHNISSNSYINLPGNSQHNSSANSSHLSGGEDVSFSNEFAMKPSEHSDPGPSVNTCRVSSHGMEGVLQTPSPSDSGVGELEQILREKDAEINTLREVMDRNERAIFQVYEERRHLWLQDIQELRDEYERKLKVQSRKSYKTEQVLSLQVYKLQQEQKVIVDEKTKVSDERDLLKQQVEDQASEISQLKIRLESLAGSDPVNTSPPDSGQQSLMEELALKNKELITVKSQLHSFEVDMDRKNKELADKVREISSKTDQLKTMKEELMRIKNPSVFVETASQTHVPSEVAVSENMKPSMLGERDKTISNLQDELLDIRAQLTALKEEHEREREQWLDEKNKVVRYQKQLQLNYVQMQRKNSTLENEVQQLTLELESRDMKLIALDEESMC
ncbi:hypothetical protein Btru_027582 [Bulinus truncatus]|nr:hypothetical protein Btru_027582 [Bulinus truncatus]